MPLNLHKKKGETQVSIYMNTAPLWNKQQNRSWLATTPQATKYTDTYVFKAEP